MKNNYKNYTNQELHDKFLPNRSIRAIESKASLCGISGKTEETISRSKLTMFDLTPDGHFKMKDEYKFLISDTKKEYYKTHESWWKGKQRSLEQREGQSKYRKENGFWSGDNNPRHINPLKGSENGRWKGGILDTYLELRSETKSWQHSSMEFCNYNCVITNEEFDDVHHIMPFRDIVDEVFETTNIEVKSKVRDYTLDDFNIIRNGVIELHNKYGYGACLNNKVHKLFHDNYGYTKCGANDFLEFVYRIDVGDFDKWFEENNLSININYNYIEYLEEKFYELEEVS